MTFRDSLMNRVCRDAEGAPAVADAFRVDWDLSAAEKQGYDHFMLKEIHEQPIAVAETLLGRDDGTGRILLDELRIDASELARVDKVFILVGVGPLRSAKTAEWMRKNVPGMHVPDALIERLRGAQDQAREGRNICIENIQEIREIRGVSGVHIMAYRQEESVAEIVDRAGILQGRMPWYPERDAAPSIERTAS